ncbi:MAG: hypothetical protein NE327_10580 [Lentisphaeraceae bacterium]|nr:hypothetical protein [Lentisphaeraceae bacterium]
MTLVLGILLFNLFLSLSFKHKVSKLRLGLTKDEVIEILGEPKQIFNAANSKDYQELSGDQALFIWLVSVEHETWVYETNFLKTINQMDVRLFQPADEDLKIEFSKEGLVINLSLPEMEKQ